MMRVWSFYDPQTGLLSGATFGGNAEMLAANTPEGLAALEGEHNHRAKRMDIATGEVVDYTPPPPSPEQVAATARAETISRILALEASQLRALREAVLSGDVRRLEAIEQEIQKLRGGL